MMPAEEVADVRDRRVQRTGVTYGNMRAKLSDYIGQVFECKADSPHYSPSPNIPQLPAFVAEVATSVE